MKIYDCFTFFNEKEILKFRLQYLKDVVDYFVIVEADTTHSGKPKEQNFSWDLVPADIHHKIIYNYISFPEVMPDPNWTSVNNEENIKAWQRENYQRFVIKDFLTLAEDEDLILITDVDEIPSINRILLLKERFDILFNYKVIALEMKTFFYTIKHQAFINDGTTELKWYHPKATIKKYLECSNLIRLTTPNVAIEDFGWHFSYFGGINRIETKIKSYAHLESNNEDNLKKIKDRVINNLDVNDRKEFIYLDRYDKSKLPKLIFSKEFKDFFEGELYE